MTACSISKNKKKKNVNINVNINSEIFYLNKNVSYLFFF